jgi:hypothetical protein
VVLALAAGVATFALVRPKAAGSSAVAGRPSEEPSPTPTPSPTPPPLPELRFKVAPITVTTTGFFSWALMDRRTGEIWGSTNISGTTWPASMIKGWVASDFLRRAAEKNQTPNTATMSELERMIRDSDNNATQDIFNRSGGNASITRLVSLCKLTDTAPDKRGWSFAAISAQDTVRMANCIANGTAAGPKWTDWILEKMRLIRNGDWGIRKALPAPESATVSIKNGWLLYDDDHNWHINCMAVTETWAMAVLQRFPGKGKYNEEFLHGQDVCKTVATQLINPDYQPAASTSPPSPSP